MKDTEKRSIKATIARYEFVNLDKEDLVKEEKEHTYMGHLKAKTCENRIRNAYKDINCVVKIKNVKHVMQKRELECETYLQISKLLEEKNVQPKRFF